MIFSAAGEDDAEKTFVSASHDGTARLWQWNQKTKAVECIGVYAVPVSSRATLSRSIDGVAVSPNKAMVSPDAIQFSQWIRAEPVWAPSGFALSPFWPHLDQCRSRMGPIWACVGPICTRAEPVWAPSGLVLSPCGPHLDQCRDRLGPIWTSAEPVWAPSGQVQIPLGPHLGPHRARFGPV